MASAKTDNGDVDGKVLVRQTALSMVQEPRVLDCFAGEGTMYQKSWKVAGEYLGIDQRFSRKKGDPRGECWQGNNAGLIVPAMKRGAWNVIDLDAYGNPWPLLRQVLKRSDQPELVVTATCGIDRAIRTGASDFAAAVAGASRLTYLGVMTRWYDDIVRWALAWCTAKTPYLVTTARRATGEHNQQMRYWLLKFERPTASNSM